MSSFEEYKTLGNKHYQSKDYNIAKTYYEKALSLDNTNAVGHSNLAMTLIKLGNYQEALNNCKLGLQCNPTDKIKEKLLWRMSTAQEELSKQVLARSHTSKNNTLGNSTVEIPIVEVDSLPLEYQ